MANRSTRPPRPLPTITLVPRTLATAQTWSYTLPWGQSGVAIGDLAWAGRHCLLLADKRGWRGIHLRFPKARWGGLRAQTITLVGANDLQLLRAVDVPTMARRHGVVLRGCAMPKGWLQRLEARLSVVVACTKRQI